MAEKPAVSKTHTLTFMGTAAGCGVPSFFCDCPACTEARENPVLARGDCGIMIRGVADGEGHVPTLIVDTPPDARHQLLREGIRRVDEILFTHAHCQKRCSADSDQKCKGGNQRYNWPADSCSRQSNFSDILDVSDVHSVNDTVKDVDKLCKHRRNCKSFYKLFDVIFSKIILFSNHSSPPLTGQIFSRFHHDDILSALLPHIVYMNRYLNVNYFSRVKMKLVKIC